MRRAFEFLCTLLPSCRAVRQEDGGKQENMCLVLVCKAHTSGIFTCCYYPVRSKYIREGSEGRKQGSWANQQLGGITGNGVVVEFLRIRHSNKPRPAGRAVPIAL
eukprot:1154838-Pelagomonas_calceolata.AAC.4